MPQDGRRQSWESCLQKRQVNTTSTRLAGSFLYDRSAHCWMPRGLHQPERRIHAKRLWYSANQPTYSGDIGVGISA
ncbi:unnamed protein product [Protopolystoma xenopodis]|uniref:Uncharacterized protein n=1 Tax=Protopolystoma xenopodis TaxID=117903 RepID=A0A448WWW1_9PLAT|nr:unnamed protein product [Protopolystoma xenopodis]